VIIARKIGKRFNKQRVLDELTLEIKAGDRVALIGANGAGKTTLIRSILGQYQVEGELTVFGKDPRKERVAVLDQLAFVPQHAPPLQMAAGELVSLNSSLSRQSSRQRVLEIASVLGLDLEENLHKPFVKLSGGMQQKLLLALALAKRPKLLIMDEPAANLDPIGRKAFFQELGKLDKSTTMLLSSHRVDELLSLINRVVELDCGKIVVNEETGRTSLANELLECKIKLLEEHPATIGNLTAWDFSKDQQTDIYRGTISGADRLRFINSLSHYANYIEMIHIN
jgi:ABC-2 type transport system ATP-binding protein